MDITITPRRLTGTVCPPPSKSMAHRLLICAALAKRPTQIICREAGADVLATVDCLRALGADIQASGTGFSVIPIGDVPPSAMLPCRESGSTLRFLLPICGALGVEATFLMEGRLPCRPLSPLWEEMERMGCRLSRPTANTLRCTGKLRPGRYRMDGSVSSQFITGLLFALSLMDGSSLEIYGQIRSRPYIEMTKQAMALFDAPGHRFPGGLPVEADWSNAAFFLAAKALGSDVTVNDLDTNSFQGDRQVLDLLPQLRNHATISAGDIPDLIPVLAVVAAANQGAEFTDIQRLRLKESDRVSTVCAMLRCLGGRAEATEDTLTVYGTGLTGGIVDAFGDHRIAMSAAIAATVCTKPVIILGAECVEKSYPTFWEECRCLGAILTEFT